MKVLPLFKCTVDGAANVRSLWAQSVKADLNNLRIPGTVGYVPTENGNVRPIFYNENGPLSKAAYNKALKFAEAVRAFEEKYSGKNASDAVGATSSSEKNISVLSLIG